MSNKNKPPSFTSIFFKSWKRTKNAHWLWGTFPFFMIFVCIIAPIVTYIQVGHSAPELDDSTAITAISAFMVLSGFLGGFSISAMTQIQTMASTYPFSSYLKDEDLFDEFIFFPQFTIGVQILSIMLHCLSVVILIFLPQKYDILVLFLNIFLLLYVISKTWQLVNLIRILTWHYEHYMRIYRQYDEDIRKD